MARLRDYHRQKWTRRYRMRPAQPSRVAQRSGDSGSHAAGGAHRHSRGRSRAIALAGRSRQPETSLSCDGDSAPSDERCARMDRARRGEGSTCAAGPRRRDRYVREQATRLRPGRTSATLLIQGRSGRIRPFPQPLDERGFNAGSASPAKSAPPHPTRVKRYGGKPMVKVVIEDELGVQIRPALRGIPPVVFFAGRQLLWRPGLSGLKQREFRQTISRLAEGNQTLYTTHSPFLVGPEELDSARRYRAHQRGERPGRPAAPAGGAWISPRAVQRRASRTSGTSTPRSARRRLSPPQREDRAPPCEHRRQGGLLRRSEPQVGPADETLIHTLGNKNILRTGDVCGSIAKPEIEDLLRGRWRSPSSATTSRSGRRTDRQHLRLGDRQLLRTASPRPTCGGLASTAPRT